ncbi:ribonuclease E/G [Asticcacaulis sp. ZE23SCel15]|uniref:ribonuclease E/G n=1 Tax=Asticcacaulis sp. ZE23SCel15 TaxID=3059027 RepID=UPI00265F864E|nr:ribonuclease E/G [Asticcacaulis sp. ZE23SCel15]WKL57396.1 ribonuclease E/G [Asticcacaulis sp. ZE23SCel15]
MSAVLYYHSRFGIARGALYIGGQPRYYDEGLEIDPSCARVGVRSVARLSGRAGGVNFLTLADGIEAVLDLPQNIKAPSLGAAVEIEIIAEARLDKRARANFIKLSDGELRRITPPVLLKTALMRHAPDALVVESDEATEYLDAAESEALSPSGPMPGGGYLSIEPTRALIACDVDAGVSDTIAVSPKQWARQCNERAILEVARRLRLSNLAGLVVVDLIGRRHDADIIRGLAQTAFGGEAARLIIAPVTKFGTLEFIRPWGAAPLRDLAYDEAGRLRPDRAARLLLRQAAEAGRHDGGRLLTIRAPSVVIDAVRDYIKGSLDPLTARLKLERDDAAPMAGKIV